MAKFTRRGALAAGASVPFAAAVPTLASAGGHAASEIPTNAFKIGDFSVTTLQIGNRVISENPQGIFGMNVSKEEFEAGSRANFVSGEMGELFFTPTLVDTGSEVILFDTGFNGEGIGAALEAAGTTTDAVDVVVLTHHHGDHIGGLTLEDGTPTFANARYVTAQTEFDHWAAAGNDGFNAKVAPLAEKMTFIGDGGSVASGITGMAAFGHTPGHMVYMLESGGSQLVLTADAANHHVWSLAYPDWEVRFDIDKEAAAASRRNLFGMLAADRIPMVGYHLPTVGYVAEGGPGGSSFQFVPATYQFS